MIGTCSRISYDSRVYRPECRGAIRVRLFFFEVGGEVPQFHVLSMVLVVPTKPSPEVAKI